MNEDSENARREKPPYQALALSVQHRNKASVDKVGMPYSGWAKRSWSIVNLLLSRHIASIKLNSSDRIRKRAIGSSYYQQYEHGVLPDGHRYW